MPLTNKIAVLDFGSQYTHLLARRVRELGVFSEIVLPSVSSEVLKGCSGIILSGGPASVYEDGAPEFNPEIFSCGKPVLGLCYGQQLMGYFFGADISPGKSKEYGFAKLVIKKKGLLFLGLSKKQVVWMSHGDQVKSLPAGFECTASTADCQNAAFEDTAKNLFGLQFHPEVTHTKNGLKILSNFVFGVCECEKNWLPKNFLKEKIDFIKKSVGGKKVFVLASGGVDSTVALALFVRAVGGKNIFTLHVDHGFMRKNESVEVKKALDKLGLKELHVVDASEQFFTALKSVVDPEQKRKIIGKLFVDVANGETGKLNWGHDWILGQGTIYPDTIETQGSKHASRIKTHHNQADIIKELSGQGRVIEPLKDLYKDEVREMGELLGLPKRLVWRQPFPGPGLAIRCLCSDGKAADISLIEQKANEISMRFGFSAKILPVKAVGVQGDFRTYRFVCALFGKMDWGKLEALSVRLTNEMNEINRVVYSVFPEKIGSVELTGSFLSKERVLLLQEADSIAMQAIARHKLLQKIWQFPVVMLPVKINGIGECIVLRPVQSREAMTARFFVLPKNALGEIVAKIKKLHGIGSIFYDITHKPPATIEWE